MWKIIKEDHQDLSFAIACLFCQAIDLLEFKLWLVQVIKDTSVDEIPFYIYDLMDFNEGLCHIYNIIGFVTHNHLSQQEDAALTGIAFLRNIDVYDPPISKNKAFKALENNPHILIEFQRFFPFVEISPTLQAA